MGFLKSLLRRKKQKDEEEITDSGVITEMPQAGRLSSDSERLGFIKDNCEQITECIKQMEEAKIEYQAVTSYLTDIQKIDMVPLEQRGSMEDAARNIFNLTQERNRLQNKSSILTDRQYRLLEQYEPVILKDLARIINSEDFQLKIDQDIKKLEKERRKLDHEQEDITNKQSFLKGMAIVISVVVILLFFMFLVLSSATEANYTIPFMLTVLMGMLSALYIILEARKNQGDIRLVQSKLKRRIMLANKVTIKAVNNRNYLDYEYSKYNVENADQLKLYWDEYVKIKEENRKYMKNTQLLDLYNNELIKELKKIGVADAEIWIFQPVAILEGKEMVEVRHRLNVRRQKLRERIDLNVKQREEALKEIKAIMIKYPELSHEGEKLLRRYRIQTEQEK